MFAEKAPVFNRRLVTLVSVELLSGERVYHLPGLGGTNDELELDYRLGSVFEVRPVCAKPVLLQPDPVSCPACELLGKRHRTASRQRTSRRQSTCGRPRRQE